MQERNCIWNEMKGLAVWCFVRSLLSWLNLEKRLYLWRFRYRSREKGLTAIVTSISFTEYLWRRRVLVGRKERMWHNTEFGKVLILSSKRVRTKSHSDFHLFERILVAAACSVGRKETMWHKIESCKVIILSAIEIDIDHILIFTKIRVSISPIFFSLHKIGFFFFNKVYQSLLFSSLSLEIFEWLFQTSIVPHLSVTISSPLFPLFWYRLYFYGTPLN